MPQAHTPPTSRRPPVLVNLRTSKCDERIDRRSMWGNPFRMVSKTDAERARVIRRYRKWILRQHDLLWSLDDLTGKRLGCWCHPKPCHGDVLIELWTAAFGRKRNKGGK